MKNTFGTNLTLTLFGESHGEAVGCVLDGLPPGLTVDPAGIAAQLTRRRPADACATARVEPDEFRVLSGVYRGKTTGTPLCILIPNTQSQHQDYVNLEKRARPGHADYTGFVKSHGFADPRGGGHFSGRLTAPLVAAGGILLPALREKGIRIGTHLARLGGVCDRAFADDPAAELTALERAAFPVLVPARGEQMRRAVLDAKARGDSVGGVLETAVCGLPAGLGAPWFDTLEGLLAHALFSVPAVKGVEFGDGFALADRNGSTANDSFRIENGRVVTETNHNGGINGGLSNGMPLVFRCAVKPTPSISLPQKSVDYVNLEETTLRIEGRHDPAIAPRAAAVVDSLTALVLADLLTGQFGADWLAG